MKRANTYIFPPRNPAKNSFPPPQAPPPPGSQHQHGQFLLEMEQLLSVSRLLNCKIEIGSLLEKVVWSAKELMGASRCSLYVPEVDNAALWRHISPTHPEEGVCLDRGLAAQVVVQAAAPDLHELRIKAIFRYTLTHAFRPLSRRRPVLWLKMLPSARASTTPSTTKQATQSTELLER